MAEKANEAREDAAMLRAAQSQETSLHQQLQEQRDQKTALLQRERDTSRIFDDIKEQLAQNQPGALNVDLTSQQLQLTAVVKDFQGQQHILLQRPLLLDDHIPLSEHVALMQCATTTLEAQLESARNKDTQTSRSISEAHEHEKLAIRNEHQHECTRALSESNKASAERREAETAYQAQLAALQRYASQLEGELQDAVTANQVQLETQLTAVQHLGARHEAECTQLRRADAAYKAQLTALQSRVSELEVAHSQLQYAHAAKQAQLTAQQQRAYQLETELTQLRGTSQEELSALKHSVSLLTTKLRTALQHHTTELEAKRAQLRDVEAANQAQLMTLHISVSQLAAERTELRTALERSVSLIEAERAQHRDVDAASQARLAALRRNIAQRETECNQLRDDLSLARCDVRALTEELNRNTQPTPNKYERLARTLGIEIPEVDLAAACQHDVVALCAQNRPGFGATEGLWLVDAANSSTVAPLERTAAAALPARSTVTARDVLRLGCSYAARGLPVATINAMLDRLTIYHEVETARTLNVSAPANAPYLQLTVPALEHPAITRTQCVALVVECDSHDQGWATDASHLNGSYRGCHSWVELHVTAPNGTVVVPRRDACRNLRARSVFRRHLLHITDTGMLAHLVAPGTRVTVSLRAHFPGWSNEARFARLAIAYKVALCDDLMRP